MKPLPVNRDITWHGFLAYWVGVLAVGLPLLLGCTRFSSGPERLPDSTFTRVLTELHIVAARHDLDAPVPRALRDSVLTHHGVSAAAFDSTIRYYTRRPQDFKALYQPIIDTLQALQYRPSADTLGPPQAPAPTP